jgi:hypothetical protein
MEPIDNVSKAMEILRRQMSENLERLRRSGKFPSPPASKSAPAGAVSASIQDTVAHKIRSIDPLEPDFDHHAAGVFIESVLTAEFGDNLLNDPGFQDMLSAVRSTMMSDERIRTQLQSLLRGLRAS